MNSMKITSCYFKLLSIFLTLSFVGGQSIIANQPNVDVPQQPGQFEYSILTPSKFQMNQGFTLMTSMGSGMSQTTGIYSNFSSYKLSDRLQFNTGIHLIQSQNSMSYSTGPQAIFLCAGHRRIARHLFRQGNPDFKWMRLVQYSSTPTGD